MGDWRRKVDRYVDSRERKERERVEREEQERQVKEEREAARQLKANRKKLTRLPCQICGTVSEEPSKKKVLDYEIDSGWGVSTYIYKWADNWDWPMGFETCLVCNRRVCADCIYKGMCKICASGWIERFLGELTRCFRR